MTGRFRRPRLGGVRRGPRLALDERGGGAAAHQLAALLLHGPRLGLVHGEHTPTYDRTARLVAKLVQGSVNGVEECKGPSSTPPLMPPGQSRRNEPPAGRAHIPR